MAEILLHPHPLNVQVEKAIPSPSHSLLLACRDISDSEMDSDMSDDLKFQLATLQYLLQGVITNEESVLNLHNRHNKKQRPHATELAVRLYPKLTEIAAIIQYEILVGRAKKIVRERQHTRAVAAIQPKKNVAGQLQRIQGPWAGQQIDPVDLNGPSAIPMPVDIGTAENFKPVFEFLKKDQVFDEADASSGIVRGNELLWGTPLLEFSRGIVYVDGRLDLCKKVVGPTHIGALMENLENNHQIQHFLLGNNVISATGARRIAEFISKFPDRMETWYLAGCYITHHGLSVLVPQMTKSSTITNLWFKRNPFGQNSDVMLAELVLKTANLRTLDLETTELGDVGTKKFISSITGSHCALRNLYLNANGIGAEASASIGAYIRDNHCELESLFLSTNPIGDTGMNYLAHGLTQNNTLHRLMLASTGLTGKGIECLADALQKSNAPLQAIDLGVSQTTHAHKQKYNYIDDSCLEALKFIILLPSLRWLSLGRTMLSEDGLQQIRSCATDSQLVYFEAYRMEAPIEGNKGPQAARSCSLPLRQTLAKNQAKFYPHIPSYDEFLRSEELRFLRNTPDVRKIDSHYRTLDKRMGLPMDTPWEKDDPTWKLILEDARLAEES